MFDGVVSTTKVRLNDEVAFVAQFDFIPDKEVGDLIWRTYGRSYTGSRLIKEEENLGHIITLHQHRR